MIKGNPRKMKITKQVGEKAVVPTEKALQTTVTSIGLKMKEK
jgi:hypothetical protein